MSVAREEAMRAAERAARAAKEAKSSSGNGTSPTGPAQRRRVWTSAELLAEPFPEPRFVVPEIVPEGLMVLAGRPKLGKVMAASRLGERRYV
jgi:hypothetical protein